MTVTWPSLERHSREVLLEWIQMHSVAQLLSATEAMAARDPECKTSIAEIAGGCVAYAGPTVPLSCAIGVGTNGAATKDDVEWIEDFYRSRNTPVKVVVSELTDPDLLPTLQSRNFQSTSVMQNWWLSLEDRSTFSGPNDIEVVKAEFDEADLWAQTVSAGFLEQNSVVNEADIPSSMLDTFFCLGFAFGAQPFFAKYKGQIVGGGVLHINGSTASLRTASCRIVHRKKGVQTALLAARLKQSTKAGCQVVFSSTDRPGPSARNLHRFGFRTLSISRTMLSS